MCTRIHSRARTAWGAEGDSGNDVNDPARRRQYETAAVGFTSVENRRHVFRTRVCVCVYDKKKYDDAYAPNISPPVDATLRATERLIEHIYVRTQRQKKQIVFTVIRIVFHNNADECLC